jgi:hypothetical protein
MADKALTRTLAHDIQLFQKQPPFSYPIVGKAIGFA